MKKITEATSLRLTPEAKRLLALLAQKFGVTKTAMIELMIREKAEREKIV